MAYLDLALHLGGTCRPFTFNGYDDDRAVYQEFSDVVGTFIGKANVDEAWNTLVRDGKIDKTFPDRDVRVKGAYAANDMTGHARTRTIPPGRVAPVSGCVCGWRDGLSSASESYLREAFCGHLESLGIDPKDPAVQAATSAAVFTAPTVGPVVDGLRGRYGGMTGQ